MKDVFPYDSHERSSSVSSSAYGRTSTVNSYGRTSSVNFITSFVCAKLIPIPFFPTTDELHRLTYNHYRLTYDNNQAIKGEKHDTNLDDGKAEMQLENDTNMRRRATKAMNKRSKEEDKKAAVLGVRFLI